VFWSQGHSTTFGSYLEEGYAGEVFDLFKSVFDGDQLSILELACGAGSTLPMALASSGECDYLGVDLAEVAQSNYVRGLVDDSPKSTVRFMGGVDVAALPTDLGCFDRIVSIFGFEYADVDQAAPRLIEHLNKGGSITMLVHNTNSVVTATSKKAAIEHVDDDIAMGLDAIRTIESEFCAGGYQINYLKDSKKADRARNKVNTLAELYIATAQTENANPVMFEFTNGLLNYFKMLGANPGVRHEYIDNLEQEFRASKARYRQMVEAAKTESQMKILEQRLLSSGLSSVEITNFTVKGEKFAWLLKASL